jgi:hypothetical protein
VSVVVGVLAGAGAAALFVAMVRSFEDPLVFLLGVIGFVLLGLGSYLYRIWFLHRGGR